jgi:tetratricopeptide (TPR) repeat protein
MTQRTFVAGALAFLLASATVPAIYMRMETEDVPIDRLVANLERELKADPANVQTLINLARLHAMAYALKADDFPGAQLKPGQPEVPAYPPGSSEIPGIVQPAPSAEIAARAAQHLKDAIRYYEAALKLAPDNMTARLGHGWVLQQSGDTQGAIKDYRLVIAQAWPSEQKIRALMPSQRLFTQEAAEYLVPLLDKKRDAAEIADLRAKQSDIAARPRAITPIAIPLTDDVPADAVLDRLARVRFDADGVGPREWTWITPDAGWLVYDAQDRRSITSALQWFGNVTFWLFWSNGYEPMRALDDNGDGELSGLELRHLAIWHDRDRDGVSDAGEVRPLAAHGIVALSCHYLDGDGVRFAALSPAGVRLSDGGSRPTYDVILQHAAATLTRREEGRLRAQGSRLRQNP